MSRWYKLDNAAKLFPTVTSASYSSVFRVSAALNEAVDGEILQKAAENIFDRFPMMFLRLRKGVFWNYFDTNRDKFTVQEETDCPCAEINPYENNGYLLKIIYYGNRVSVEMFHSLTDGGGAVEFLKSLLFEYFRFLGDDLDSEGKVLLADEGVSPAELEDSFSRFYAPEHRDKREAVKPSRSFRIKGATFEAHGNNVTTGIVSARELIKRAKAKNATVTAYLAVLLIHSIYTEQQKYTTSQAPIVVAVPVNLRKVFPSSTLRNFFAVANVGVTVAAESSMKLDDVIVETSRQLKARTDKQALQAFITDNVSLEKKLYSRFVPLFIKKILMMIGSDIMGESLKTISLSNLGSISVPTGFLSRVSHMEMNLYPTPKSPINCAVCSLGDKLAISFSRTIIESDIIRRFFGGLAENGLEVEIYSNDWGREHD